MVPTRARSTAVAAILAAGLGPGCGAAPRALTGLIVQRSALATESSAETALAAPVILPAMADAFVVSTDPASGERRVVMGAVRAALRGPSIDLADDRPAAAIREAIPLGTRWVFLARDGTVVAADTFLGPLRRLGALPPGYRILRGSRGRMLVLDAGGALLASDGTAPFGPLASLPPGTVVDAVFVDADAGLALVEGGEIYRTGNGGRAWARVDLGPEAAFRLLADNGEFAAETTAGPRVITPQGVVSPRPAPLPPPVAPAAASPTAALPEPDADRLLGAVMARFPGLPYAYGAVQLAGGSLVGLQGGTFTVMQLATGHRTRVPAPPGATACAIHPWGGTAGVACSGGIARLTATGPVRLGGAAGLTDVSFSDDGGHVALRGALCGAPGAAVAAVDAFLDGSHVTPGADASERLCVGSGGASSLTSRAAPGQNARLLGMHGGLLLLAVDREDTADLGLRVLDTDRGGVTRVRTAPSSIAAEITAREARWLPGGAGLYAVGVWANEARDDEAGEVADDGEGDGEGVPAAPVEHRARSSHPERARVAPVLLWGAAGAPLEVRPLPEGAEVVGFADGVHGVAAGASIEQLYRTADGGLHWERLAPALDGAAKSVRLDVERATGLTSVRCGRWGCVVGGRVWFPSAGTPSRAGGTTLAPTTANAAITPEGDVSVRAPNATRAPDVANGWSAQLAYQRMNIARPTIVPGTGVDPAAGAGRYMCTGPAAGITSLLRVLAPSRRGALRRTLATAGADGLLDAWTDRGRAMLQFRWNGEDAAGNFQGTTLPAPSRARDPAADVRQGLPPRYSFWAAGRGGAILERCIEGVPEAPCEVLWAPVHGALAPLPDLTAFGASLHGRVAVDGVLPTGNGSYLVLTSGHTADSTVAVDMVALLGPDGRVLFRRAFAFHERRIHALARVHGTVGYASAKTSDPRAFVFYPVDPAGTLGPAAPLPVIPTAPIDLCPAAAWPDATELLISASGFVPEVLIVGSAPLPLAALLELRATQTCVRAVQSVAPLTATMPSPVMAASRGLRLTVGNDGRLAGLLDDGTLSRLLQCAPR